MSFCQDENGKTVFMSVDSADIPFTKNDISLHFIILDLYGAIWLILQKGGLATFSYILFLGIECFFSYIYLLGNTRTLFTGQRVILTAGGIIVYNLIHNQENSLTLFYLTVGL